MLNNQVPLLGQQEHQIKLALAQQLHSLTTEIYIHAVASLVGAEGSVDDFREIAQESRVAARAFFEGLGIAEFKAQD